MTRFFWAALLSLLAPALWALDHAPGELLVSFKAEARPARGAKADPRDSLHAALGARLLNRLDAIQVDRVALEPGADEGAVLAAYLREPLVKTVERNRIYRAFAGPNDPIYVSGQQSCYDRIAAGSAFDAWKAGAPAYALSSTITVAVLDTGIHAHNELSGLLLSGQSFHDGEPTTEDLNGHGTFVTGILAALTDNNAGLAGVFFDKDLIRILPVKVLGASGDGLASEVAAGILYAVDQGARVINMSFGDREPSDAVESAVSLARSRGHFVVAAAGNDNSSASYPAAYPAVLSVAALDSADGRASYSNYGRVDIAAPGGDAALSCSCVLDPTLVPSACVDEVWSLCDNANQYRAGAGTSYACPMVAAAAALLLSQKSSRGPDDLYRILTQTTDPTALGPGYNHETGWGRLDVYKALGYGNGPVSSPGSALKVYNWPNPFHPDRDGETHVTFFLENPDETRLRVMDLSGDLVFEKTLSAGQTNAGMNLVSWDGKNGAGRKVAVGAYLVTVASGSKVGRNRMAVLR